MTEIKRDYTALDRTPDVLDKTREGCGATDLRGAAASGMTQTSTFNQPNPDATSRPPRLSYSN